MKSNSERYREAGVDINAGYRAVELMKASVERTRIPGVVSGIGGFGGLFRPDLGGMRRPVLVSGTDGVGTKLKLAFQMDRHDTIGIDCVAMCVNDVLCAGARPLFFLDYVAVGRNLPERVARIVAGEAEGCVQAGCALIGGETAEMPGFYPPDEYDLAGFCVGIVDEDRIIDRARVAPGDVLIGLPSSGVHSNGFSLVRRVLDGRGLRLDQPFEGGTLGEALLTPTRIYVKPVLRLIEALPVKGIAHITGGGLYENIPRSLPEGLQASIEKAAISRPAVFDLIMKEGGIPEEEMYGTFNMGLGLCLTVGREDADRALALLRDSGERPAVIGEVLRGGEPLRLW